jgi:hypothetical protein
MEDNVFPRPAVAGLLEAEYVEARLHTDGSTNIERILELQESLARSVANPIYVILDPETEQELARHEGAALTGGQREVFLEFLRGPTE